MNPNAIALLGMSSWILAQGAWTLTAINLQGWEHEPWALVTPTDIYPVHFSALYTSLISCTTVIHLFFKVQKVDSGTNALSHGPSIFIALQRARWSPQFAVQNHIHKLSAVVWKWAKNYRAIGRLKFQVLTFLTGSHTLKLAHLPFPTHPYIQMRSSLSHHPSKPQDSPICPALFLKSWVSGIGLARGCWWKGVEERKKLW